ncbi:MAG: ABC transporter substrate-binding protein [Anaerolineae bacterium]|nr:ABC transporter substrate-binding protein [Anaerolineae bacterium]MCB0237634.1 ABC transporter substrate-binding protein [Anaerolineae bacterium]MCB0246954.1 ABC transporter substrate-binding protein [Anaerolineae bacterium]MCB9130498.1 ABC transporter substrate-binding protein [Anaerolineales bacterium]MCO5242253.1 ABC transporter substrate-binding protein [Anaerolineae bacterium]
MITNKRYIVGLLILLMSILIGACSSAPVDTTAIDAANATAATAEAKLAEAEAAAAKAEANAAASAEEIAAAKAEAEAAKVEAEAAMAAAETAKAEAAAAVPAAEVEMTDVGTPRNETLIFQTFDRQTADPGNMNPMLAYARWRGFRELGWGWLWETDTGTGESYGELAAGPAEPLNDEHTKFRVKLKEGIYWSDGVEFTADDVIYTLETNFACKDIATRVTGVVTYVKEGGWEKIDDYTVEIETQKPSYDFQQNLGVRTWGSNFVPLPKHVFEKENACEFRNTYPVTLGPYVIKEFDENGFWHLWELREDWQRSAWADLDKDGFMPKYVLYKDYGPEETRSLSFVQNAYDVDTFMSPDTIKAVQNLNDSVTTFSPTMPYHNMDDACVYGMLINMQQPPYDLKNVRWALALAMDLESIAINAVSGEAIVSPWPMADTQILRPIYYDPLQPWLEEFTLDDGYQPFNPNFGAELAAKLKEGGAEDIPEDTTDFGVGWWKYDVEEAAKLLEAEGFTKNADGNWLLPSGEEWVVNLIIPSDWNKVMQRIGFAVADSWRTAGIQTNVRQVDSAENSTVQTINAQHEVQFMWTNCIFTPSWMGAWQELQPGHIKAGDSQERNDANRQQWDNETVYKLVEDSKSLEQDSEEFYENGRLIMKEFVTDMSWINMMNIPTTIPTNEHYWTGFPKADNYYAVPYSWWSSAKEMVAAIQPTGN